MKLRILIENSKLRDVFQYDPQVPDRVTVGLRMLAWLDSAVASAAASGVCKSFVVAIHVDDERCEHDTGVPYG